MLNRLKSAILRRLPQEFREARHFRRQDERRAGRSEAELFPDRVDVRVFDVQPDVLIRTYWKSLAQGVGTCMKLEVRGREVVKFDCFGVPKGHYHTALTYDRESGIERAYLPEKTRSEQIDRAAFDIGANGRYFQKRHPLKHVRAVDIDPVALRRAAEEAAKYARDLDALHTPAELERLGLAAE